MEFVFVGIGGAMGACLRYFLNKVILVSSGGFPFATLVSNVLAGFLIGVIFGLDINISPIDKRLKLFLTTGFLGGLSTFSTFNIETATLFTNGKYLLACGNVALNLSLSFLGVGLGLFITSLFKLRA